jgi:hypothetical protein
MTQSSWQLHLKWIVKLNIVIWIVNCLVFVALTLLHFNAGFLSYYFSKVLFLETGIAFLTGGIIAFSSSALPSKTREYISKSTENWSIETLKQGEKRANKYFILAVVLLTQSILLSLIGL